MKSALVWVSSNVNCLSAQLSWQLVLRVLKHISRRQDPDQCKQCSAVCLKALVGFSAEKILPSLISVALSSISFIYLLILLSYIT